MRYSLLSLALAAFLSVPALAGTNDAPPFSGVSEQNQPTANLTVSTEPLPAPDYEFGSIVIKTDEHKLYYFDEKNKVTIFSIAVGKQGQKWSGVTEVARKVMHPKWAPPDNIRADNPALPAVIDAGPNNPLGVAVLVLGDGTYGIHGTNRDETIGKDASYGCFRMHNADILALFEKVKVGTAVTVIP